MVDIHTHILPNVDDGAKSLEISIELLKEEIKNGVRDIVLTPHQNENEMDNKKLKELFLKFKDEVKDLGLNLYLGSEIYYYKNLKNDIEKITTMNDSKYILIEFSITNKIDIYDSCVELKNLGFKPIIAHIERYHYLTLEDIDDISSIAKIQVNTKSFIKKEYKKLIKYLLKNDLIDYIGTDCHDLEYRDVSYNLINKYMKKYPKFKEKIEKMPEFLS